MSPESPEVTYLPIYEEIERQRDIPFKIRERIANGETTIELLKAYFAAERDFKKWAFSNADPNNPYHNQKNLKREADEIDALINAGPMAWAKFCRTMANSSKAATRDRYVLEHFTQGLQGEEKERAEMQAANWENFEKSLTAKSSQ